MSRHDAPVLEDAACPVCDTRDDEQVLTGRDLLHGLPGEFSVVRCTHCGLMRTNPRPTPATIGFYYPEDYAPYQNTAPEVGESPVGAPQRFRGLVHRVLQTESRRLPRAAPGLLLEIGCASGSYLNEMRHQGWQVQGIEFAESAAKRARALGLDVQCAGIETAVPPAEKVDIVAAWMVLEHLHNPVESLGRIRQWVKPDGYLVASVPDAGSMIRRIFGRRSYDLQLPSHLFHYTPDTLKLVLQRSGWELTRIFWQRNSNTLLWSLEYLARDKGLALLENASRWTRTAVRAAPLRVALNTLLGLTRQSGRIEIWARPVAMEQEE